MSDLDLGLTQLVSINDMHHVAVQAAHHLSVMWTELTDPLTED